MSVEEMVCLIENAPVGPWPDGWAGWDNVRDAHIDMMQKAIVSCPSYPGTFEGRGIVSCVSAKPGHSSGKELSNGYFPGAYVMVKELRRLGCTLPVLFAHLGPLEWDPSLTRLVRPLGVEVVDLREIAKHHPLRILAGWEAKIYSIIHAPFKEVLYLDADCLPLRDPTFLFRSSPYKHHGAVFWPDVPPYDRDEWLPECVWRNIGLSYRNEIDFESGQLVIDKERCWRACKLTEWINAHSDYFYRFVFGDKSTFHLAWAKLGLGWAMPHALPGGNSASLFQNAFDGTILFQHCTRNKPTLMDFPARECLVNQEDCIRHLKELQTLWSGRLWENDRPESDEAYVIARLTGRTMIYRRLPREDFKGDERRLRFLEDHTVGRGKARCETGWSYMGGFLSILNVDGGVTALLRESEDGVWRGRWLDFEQCECELIPQEEVARACA
jgi:hypothetical protein